MAFDRSMVDLLCHRSFFSCKDNTYAECVNQQQQQQQLCILYALYILLYTLLYILLYILYEVEEKG